MRFRFLLHTAGALSLAVLLETSSSMARGQATDVLSYHGGTVASNGVNSTEQVLTPALVNVNSFGKLFSTTITDVPNASAIPASSLDPTKDYVAPGGQVYAEPLVKTGVNITTGNYTGVHDVVFVATAMDSLYAIDAIGGNVLWKDSFIYNASGNLNPLNATIPVGVTAVPGGIGTDINTSDVAPWVGIISTPVIDGVNGYIYLVAKTREVPNGDQTHPHYVSTLHKISLSNGVDTKVVMADTTIQISNTTFTYNSGPYVIGTASDAISVSGQNRIYFNAVRQMVRAALELYGGQIYIASGSHGDNDPYHGWVLTYDANTLACTGAWNDSPNSGGQGGVWQGGGGVVIDSSGYIYFQTGNGAFDGTISNNVVSGLDTNGFPAQGDYGDCFVKLALDSSTTQGNQGSNLNGWGLKVADYFSPHENQTLNQEDADLGSGGPTLLPDSAGSTAFPHLLLGGGKEGILYLINRDNMGKFGVTDNVVQKFTATTGMDSVPAFFNGALYLTPGYGGNPMSWPLTNAVIATGSAQNSPDSIAFPGCSPSITASGTANGVVWIVDKGTGQLRAYNASNMATELWTSNQNATRDSLGSGVKFACATPANGIVYVGTSSQLVAYSSTITSTSAPAAPTGLIATATGASTISLSWTDNSNNETSFLIERSSDGINFTQIGTVGVNVTTFTDQNLSYDETYYYRVRAANTFQTLSYSAYTNIANATTTSIYSEQPVNLYHFDEGVGTATLDSVGGNNGTLIGTGLPLWISPGRIGSSSLSFSGNGQYLQSGESAVQVTNDFSPTLGGTSSLLFWIKTTQTGNNTPNMAPAVTGAEQATGENGISWGYLDATGRIGVAVGTGHVVSASPVNDGSWHQIALSRNASTGLVSIYVGGALSNSAMLETGSKTSQFFLLGALSDVNSDGVTLAGANYLNAQLDDVEIYNLVIDPADVAAIATPPATPTDLVAVPTSGTELELTWNDNANNETEYEVWSSVSGGAFTEISELPVNSDSFSDIGLTDDTDYSFYVVATDSAGSTQSNTASTMTPVPPATPSNLMATYLSPTEIDLQWTNNATDDTGYTILREVGSATFTQLPSLPANTTSYKDTTVQPGTSYDYHVEAYNTAGYSDFAGLTITTPLQSQYQTYFSQYGLSNPSPTALNSYGIPYLLTYAFNTDPLVSDPDGLPVVSEQNGYLAITFVQRIPPTDLNYTVQVSSDLVNWSSGPTITTQTAVTPINSASQSVTVRDNTLLNTLNKRFIRVNVTH
jgi:hypothetical protein